MPTIACSNCAQKLRYEDDKAGRKVRCPKCQEPILLEGPSTDSSPGAAPASKSKPIKSAVPYVERPKQQRPKRRPAEQLDDLEDYEDDEDDFDDGWEPVPKKRTKKTTRKTKNFSLQMLTKGLPSFEELWKRQELLAALIVIAINGALIIYTKLDTDAGPAIIFIICACYAIMIKANIIWCLLRTLIDEECGLILAIGTLGIYPLILSMTNERYRQHWLIFYFCLAAIFVNASTVIRIGRP